MNRRHFVRTGLVLLGGSQLGKVLAATPECVDEPTPPQTAGPFYTPDSPQRTSLLEPELAGERLLLSGRVLDRDCRPLAGVWLDFWQADADGAYDNRGYRLRGHQYSDDQGGYRLETILPGLYPGRTRHIHVRVGTPGRRMLTTQLYFPDVPQNQRDWLFQPELLVTPDDSDPRRAGFDFVLDSAG